MAGGVNPGWVRAAALGILASWVPCMPLGVCMATEPAKPAAHHCCPRPASPALKVAASPQDCWVQSSPTTAPAAIPWALGAPAAGAAHALPGAEPVTPQETRRAEFSPLAVVLRI